jgi:transposase
MKQKSNIYLCAGMDVSKDTIDVYYNGLTGEHHLKVSNNSQGFKQIVERIGIQHHYVMETTGPYYLKLAFYLKEKCCKITVENSLTIKRFIQMNNERNKNDKKDASWIFRYGVLHQPECWQLPSGIYIECMQIQNAIALLTKQFTMTSNLLHSMDHMPVQQKRSLKILQKHLKVIHKEIHKLEAELEVKIRSWAPQQIDNLKSIPGLGTRTASQLIIFTDAFNKVDNYRQLISLAGLSPREFTSGTSVKKRIRICKMGGSDLRKLLYMCSMTAIKKNKACRELYERIKAKGKNGKLALIAVCNKLLKQAFAIAKSGLKYDENYLSARSC